MKILFLIALSVGYGLAGAYLVLAGFFADWNVIDHLMSITLSTNVQPKTNSNLSWCVALVGGVWIGCACHNGFGLFIHAGVRNDFQSRYFWFYVSRPIFASLVAFAVFLFIQIGLVVFGSAGANTHVFYAYAAVGVFVGLASESVTVRLTQLGATWLGVRDSPILVADDSNSLQVSVALPIIAPTIDTKAP